MQKKICIFLLFFSLSFYGQNDTISVVKHTEKDIVVDKNSKVVYRGMVNSLLIDVPNCRSFTAAADGLTMISKSHYNLNPSAGSEVIITIEIVLKNNKKVTEKHKFRIKNLSNVVCSINNLKGEKISLQKSKLNNSIISVSSLNENLDYKLSIIKFNIYFPNGKNIEVFGNKINNNVFKIINNKVSKYDIIKISNIQVKINSSFQGCIRPAPIEIKII